MARCVKIKLFWTLYSTASLWICKPLLSKNKLLRYLSWKTNVCCFGNFYFNFFPTNVQVGSNVSVLRQNTISFPTNGNDLLAWWVFSALASGIFIWFRRHTCSGLQIYHIYWIWNHCIICGSLRKSVTLIGILHYGSLNLLAYMAIETSHFLISL